GARSLEAVVVLGAMVVLLATGVVPAVIATMLAAGAMIVLRVVSVQQAYRGISWPTVLLVAGFIVTVAFGQLISNTATALVMIPVAVSAAHQLDVSARPVLMSV